MLSNKEIDAVIIALLIPAQPEYIKAALKAGKHVLSEKPIAKDMSTAQDLLKWYHSSIDTPKTTWSVAENFRYMSRFQHAGQQVAKLGRVLGFRHRMHAFVAPGSKYYETAWRKTPEYQGGFLLDGGVHFIAGLRLMLGDDAKMETVSAFSAQLQEHLPPVDTVNASVKLRNGASGTFSVSFGTTFTGAEWIVACEQGTVECDRDRVIVRRKDSEEEEVEEFPDDGNGVVQEVRAWAESIEQGKHDALQSPEEALRDLEIVSYLYYWQKKKWKKAVRVPWGCAFANVCVCSLRLC